MCSGFALISYKKMVVKYKPHMIFKRYPKEKMSYYMGDNSQLETSRDTVNINRITSKEMKLSL